jgi:hypothetical protein
VSREMGLGGEVGLPHTSGLGGVTKIPMFKPNTLDPTWIACLTWHLSQNGAFYPSKQPLEKE